LSGRTEPVIITNVQCAYGYKSPALAKARPWEMRSMNRDELLRRISIDPDICFGKPCIRGHRIWVSLILDLLAAGTSVEELLADYPGLMRDDVLACIAYGAEMSRERYVDIPMSKPA
jgi:uncharacterized protein (DUF433 family)